MAKYYGAEVLRPVMLPKSHELIGSFAGDSAAGTRAAFAEPYPAWVIAEPLGIPGELFDGLLGRLRILADIGLGFGAAAAMEQIGSMRSSPDFMPAATN